MSAWNTNKDRFIGLAMCLMFMSSSSTDFGSCNTNTNNKQKRGMQAAHGKHQGSRTTAMS